MFEIEIEITYETEENNREEKYCVFFLALALYMVSLSITERFPEVSRIHQ
jgi:hypothetical protein